MSLFRYILSSRFSDPMFLLNWDRNQNQDWHWALFHFSYYILYLLLIPEQVLSKWSATTLEHQWLGMTYCLRPTSNWPQQLERDSSPRVGIWNFSEPTNRFDIETIGLNEFWKFQLKKNLPNVFLVPRGVKSFWFHGLISVKLTKSQKSERHTKFSCRQPPMKLEFRGNQISLFHSFASCNDLLWHRP